MTSNATYLNGEVSALRDARSKAQETVSRIDRALAILEGSGTERLVSGATLGGRMGRAVAEHLQRGRKVRDVAKRYGVSDVTVYNWVRKYRAAQGHVSDIK